MRARVRARVRVRVRARARARARVRVRVCVCACACVCVHVRFIGAAVGRLLRLAILHVWLVAVADRVGGEERVQSVL